MLIYLYQDHLGDDHKGVLGKLRLHSYQEIVLQRTGWEPVDQLDTITVKLTLYDGSTTTQELITWLNFLNRVDVHTTRQSQ